MTEPRDRREDRQGTLDLQEDTGQPSVTSRRQDMALRSVTSQSGHWTRPLWWPSLETGRRQAGTLDLQEDTGQPSVTSRRQDMALRSVTSQSGHWTRPLWWRSLETGKKTGRGHLTYKRTPVSHWWRPHRQDMALRSVTSQSGHWTRPLWWRSLETGRRQAGDTWPTRGLWA